MRLHRMAGNDLCEHVAQIGLRIEAVHLASFDERGNDRPMLAAAVGAGEEVVLAAERGLADRALDDLASSRLRRAPQDAVKTSLTMDRALIASSLYL